MGLSQWRVLCIKSKSACMACASSPAGARCMDHAVGHSLVNANFTLSPSDREVSTDRLPLMNAYGADALDL